jgi:membrane associated rhomboid family serine protease
MVLRTLQERPVDPDPAKTLNAYNLGASGGLMSMMAVVAVWKGGSLWGLPLVNIPVQARFIGLLTLARDFYGNYNNSPDGIGHNAHLCGMGVGAGIALFGLSRGRYSKACKIIVKR